MVMAAATVTVECAYCSKTFVARRTSARFCSQGCRKNWSRRKEKIDSEVNSIRAALTNIERQVERWPDLRQYADASLAVSDIYKAYGTAANRAREAAKAAQAKHSTAAPKAPTGSTVAPAPTAPKAPTGSNGSEVSHDD